MAAGTDMNNFHVIDELMEMVRLGLSPVEAVNVGCCNGSKAVGLGDVTGMIEKGYSADMVLVKGDVEQNISLMKNPCAVYFCGKKV